MERAGSEDQPVNSFQFKVLNQKTPTQKPMLRGEVTYKQFMVSSFQYSVSGAKPHMAGVTQRARPITCSEQNVSWPRSLHRLFGHHHCRC